MKNQRISRLLLSALLLAAAVSGGVPNLFSPVLASGGGTTSSVDTIKVGKAEYAVTTGYVELLISASSSNSSAHLYAYLPDGTYLGEVQNGGGGRYGGTVFLSAYVPLTITIKSSAGGSITVSTTPYQP